MRPTVQHLTRNSLAAALPLLLVACGGGAGGSGSGVLDVSSPSVQALAGQTATVNGYARTAGQGIASAAWSQVSGPVGLALANANCNQSSKSVLSSAGTASAPAGAVALSYTCPLTVQVPATAPAGDYVVRFTVTDSAGHEQSSDATLHVLPAAVAPLSAVAGPNANLYPGQTYKGSCQTVGGVFNPGQTPTYQWSITGPVGVTPPALTASGPSVSLTAPVLASPANFTLVCQATDGAGSVATGTANLSVYGTSALPPLLANAGSAMVAPTATAVTLTASAQANGAAPQAPVYYYWQQTGGAHTVTIANATSANASFVTPGNPSAPGSSTSSPPSVYDTLTFTVYVSYQPIDPNNLTAIPASQQAQTVVTVIQQ